MDAYDLIHSCLCGSEEPMPANDNINFLPCTPPVLAASGKTPSKKENRKPWTNYIVALGADVILQTDIFNEIL